MKDWAEIRINKGNGEWLVGIRTKQNEVLKVKEIIQEGRSSSAMSKAVGQMKTEN